MRIFVVIATLFTCSIGLAQERIYADPERAYSAFGDDEHRQFDFWIGEWDVNLRIIDENNEWQDRISAKVSIYPILHGKAILELWDSEPIKGYSLRYYDPQQDQWVLWLNWPGKNRSGTSSLTGGFRHGRGDFFTEYPGEEGEVITQRYSFNDITPFSLRWDDLVSNDGGETWRENWRMEFTRTAVDPEWALGRDYAQTYDTGVRCDAEQFRAYETLAGHWHGRFNGDKASMSAWKILDGCAVMVFVDVEKRNGPKRFMFITFDTVSERWEVSWLDDDRNNSLRRLVSATDWSQTRFGNSALSWVTEGDALQFSFTSADGKVESGEFERQDLENH